MENFLSNPLLFSGTSIQTMHLNIGCWFDFIMIAATLLGSSLVYSLLALLLFFRKNYTQAAICSLLILLSILINYYTKGLFKAARPEAILDISCLQYFIDTLRPSTYSFPSGHAQNSVVFWGSLMLMYRDKLLLISGTIAIFTISYSRIYLAFHYPGDILGGWLTGCIILAPLALLLRWKNKLQD